MAPSSPLKLAVLYYKRTNKVHKNRGTTKEDGHLTIAPPPSCVVTLSSASDDHEEEEEEEEEYATKKKKWNAARKSISSGTNRKSGVIFSGVNNEIARKAFGGDEGIDEDDVLVLNGQWECQVVFVLNGGDEGSAPAGKKASNTMGVMKRAPLVPLRKNPIKTVQKPLVSKSAIGVKRPPVQPAAIGVKRPSLQSTKSSAAASAPVPVTAGKLKKNKDGEWYLEGEDESDDSDAEQNDVRPAPLSSKIPSSLLNNKRPKIVSRPGALKSIVSDGAAASKSRNENEFPGATGINVPVSIQKILRSHQREGIAFLWNCVTGANEGLKRVFEQRGEEKSSDNDEQGKSDGGAVPRGAVLADEMGLGKTLMTIATIYAVHRRTRDRRFIVVCPSSLVSNWAKEFDKWIGKASQPKRVVVRNGSEEGIRNLKAFVPVKPHQAEVLILSYELLRLHIKLVSKATKVCLLVVDEGHRLKNTAGSQTLSALNSLDAEARILITGTPIQNNLSEFYNVANFALPGVLADLSTFRRLYERPLSQANSKNATREQKERGRKQSKALDEITSTFVLRRLQKDVLKSLLPPRMELLLFCRPSSKQCELYQAISDRACKSLGGRDDNPLMLLTELRKLCTHPSLLAKDESPEDHDVSLSGKLVVLDRLIDSIREKHPTDKVVIISNFTTALSVIETCILRRKSLPFVRLDGSVELSARQPMVDAFNNGSVNHSFAFLLSSKAGGCGLNLLGANRLIMVDADWNPATDQQAMARVYRQGQTKPCYIYRMFTTGTVEEVIFQRQTQKGNLAQLANDGGKSKSNSHSNFTPEELRDCFTLKQGCKCDTKNKLGKRWSDYSGVKSLRNQGCIDQPLLAVCDDLTDTLSFVRVVDNEPVTVDDSDQPSVDVVSYTKDVLSESDEDVDSSEEEEFEG